MFFYMFPTLYTCCFDRCVRLHVISIFSCYEVLVRATHNDLEIPSGCLGLVEKAARKFHPIKFNRCDRRILRNTYSTTPAKWHLWAFNSRLNRSNARRHTVHAVSVTPRRPPLCSVHNQVPLYPGHPSKTALTPPPPPPPPCLELWKPSTSVLCWSSKVTTIEARHHCWW